MAQQIKNLLKMQETQELQVGSLVWENLLEEGMATHAEFLPEKYQGQRSLAGYSPKGLQRVRHD